LELTVATGYAQGFGSLQEGVGMPRVAGPGIGAELGIGYRATPHWGIAGIGQYQELTSERADAARGVTGTLAVQYHISPRTRVDPWIDFGVGYRVLWEPLPTSATLVHHGLQLGRARIGLDLRGQDVAIAPVIGADITTFLWQDLGSVDAVTDPRASVFVFAGLQGRLDVGGTKTSTTRVTSSDLPAY
jgi:hypothetical protein